jgi:hypothetical protein
MPYVEGYPEQKKGDSTKSNRPFQKYHSELLSDFIQTSGFTEKFS